MAEFVQKGESLNYRNEGSELIRYGEVVVLEERIGVAGIDIPAGSLRSEERRVGKECRL